MKRYNFSTKSFAKVSKGRFGNCYPDLKTKRVTYAELKIGDYIADGYEEVHSIAEVTELRKNKKGWTLVVIQSLVDSDPVGNVWNEDNVSQVEDEFYIITNYREVFNR